MIWRQLRDWHTQNTNKSTTTVYKLMHILVKYVNNEQGPNKAVKI